jgi:hypothetical protein
MGGDRHTGAFEPRVIECPPRSPVVGQREPAFLHQQLRMCGSKNFDEAVLLGLLIRAEQKEGPTLPPAAKSAPSLWQGTESSVQTRNVGGTHEAKRDSNFGFFLPCIEATSILSRSPLFVGIA